MDTSTHDHEQTTLILVPGYWLGAWAWDEVRAHLDAAGHDSLALTLPGRDPDDPDRATRTLADQTRAIEEVLRGQCARGRRCVVVAHSGANAPVSLALDHHPERVAHVVWVDSGPVSGTSVAGSGQGHEPLPLPPVEVLGEQASLEGLDEAALARFRERAVPEPAGVVGQPVDVRDEARFGVPTTMVCCSLTGSQVQQLAEGGNPMFADVARLRQVELIDLPTGHWPMWSRPGELAALLGGIARRAADD